MRQPMHESHTIAYIQSWHGVIERILKYIFAFSCGMLPRIFLKCSVVLQNKWKQLGYSKAPGSVMVLCSETTYSQTPNKPLSQQKYCVRTTFVNTVKPANNSQFESIPTAGKPEFFPSGVSAQTPSCPGCQMQIFRHVCKVFFGCSDYMDCMFLENINACMNKAVLHLF